MKIYHIKKDGFILGSAKGKFKAVKYLEDHLRIAGTKESIWNTACGDIWVNTIDGIYTIDEVRIWDTSGKQVKTGIYRKKDIFALLLNGNFTKRNLESI